MRTYVVNVGQVHDLNVQVRQDLVQVLRAVYARQRASLCKVGVHEDDVEASDGEDPVVAQGGEGVQLDALVQRVELGLELLLPQLMLVPEKEPSCEDGPEKE